MEPMKSKSRTGTSPKSDVKSDYKSGLPGTPEEQRRGLRDTMKKHAETLRRLGQ
jgi:hypothetical protein